LALVEFADVLERTVADARPPDEGVAQLLHMSLANYAAGAIMMPYGRFLKACEDMRYSIDRLSGEFGANTEQVAHRFTTLSRPGALGVPFFMLRVDPAGNISKRYAGDRFPFSHFGGTCPRWNLHAAFQAAGQVVTQLIETPDGHRYFTVARTIDRPIKSDLSGGLLAIGLGCDIRYAHKLSCAEGYDLANAPVTPVGPACALCPRLDCGYRATAPAGRMLAVDRLKKTISPYPFVAGSLRSDRLPLQRRPVPEREVRRAIVGRAQEQHQCPLGRRRLPYKSVGQDVFAQGGVEDRAFQILGGIAETGRLGIGIAVE
jgi:predicted transcriptional regulator